ncbi:hypothetical protein MPTK1_3g03680 [Marchantia polymorpha subsp. ruderalis]|uniref:Uncharacterized protein n=2 Tax=Marchantia polymorpha TaxID=3197 RepID=A0AAF6AX43_MARPO|nr:hypothetical protein MARPO_0022s0164 [Marchantia polymorpha]BBN04327.1 hypothetical protein Mp_3g03680 [Marchantia polymorpha subsp. ruderalis]|eukprot:PTQ44078.1 hypothetical protein MARPO_0022s0164 [Marchantia polymorpha]
MHFILESRGYPRKILKSITSEKERRASNAAVCIPLVLALASFEPNQEVNTSNPIIEVCVSKLDPATCFSTHPIHHESAVEMVTTTWPLKIKMMHRAAEG